MTLSVGGGLRRYRWTARRQLRGVELLEGYDHNAPPDVITPILIDVFGEHR